MNDDTRRYLDDEVGLGDLRGDARAEADAWGRLLDAFRADVAAAAAPAWLEERVMAEIEALPRPGWPMRAVRWWVRPRTVRVPPLAAGLAFAALAALTLWAGRTRVAPAPTAGTAAAQAVVYVQFELAAPGARSVAVGGDFDGWSGSHLLEDRDGDGVWTGRVAIRPGLHTYMFLVDGVDWVTDPEATRHTDDGFGNRNAVLAVAAPAA
jgi:hypothetical protein